VEALSISSTTCSGIPEPQSSSGRDGGGCSRCSCRDQPRVVITGRQGKAPGDHAREARAGRTSDRSGPEAGPPSRRCPCGTGPPDLATGLPSFHRHNPSMRAGSAPRPTRVDDNSPSPEQGISAPDWRRVPTDRRSRGKPKGYRQCAPALASFRYFRSGKRPVKLAAMRRQGLLWLNAALSVIPASLFRGSGRRGTRGASESRSAAVQGKTVRRS